MCDFLLSIAIPTYNRANYLNCCLQHICKQLIDNRSVVEILVSDNGSNDGTAMIVQQYISNGYAIKYIKNPLNVGPDVNIAQCFDQAKGKYVWIFGDDDILLEGALGKILKILNGDEYGVVYLNSYGFKRDHYMEKPWKWGGDTLVYTTQYAFFKRVNYWVTFITANIINKSFYDSTLDRNIFLQSNLVQLSWTFSAALKAPRNMVMNEYLIAAKAQNSGGYGLCNVFGHNLNNIIQFFAQRGLETDSVDAINNKLLLTFFPGMIATLRKGKNDFQCEDFYAELYPLFKRYVRFWLILVPIMKLPVTLAFFYSLPFRIWTRVARFI